MPSPSHRRMLEMQARLPSLAGFCGSPRSKTHGKINSKDELTPTSTREPSKASESNCGEDSPSESSVTNLRQYLVKSHCPEDDDIFIPSEPSDMPRTREPSPEPFWDAAKRYGWREETLYPPQERLPIPHYQIPYMHSSIHIPSSSMRRNLPDRGVSLDYLAQFDSQGVSKGPYEHFAAL